MHSEAVHAGVIWVSPVGQHLYLDDLEGSVTLLLSRTKNRQNNTSQKYRSHFPVLYANKHHWDKKKELHVEHLLNLQEGNNDFEFVCEETPFSITHSDRVGL